jgi:two-component system NtrC family sensor kinase
MMREDTPVGVIVVTRSEARPFTEKQIELATTFADQAAIAIENIRLFEKVQAKTRDLSESLEQQTSTAEVLKVISRSAFDLDSVMNTLAHSAAELCKSEINALYLREGDVLVARGVADADSAQADFLRRTPLQSDSSTYIGRALLAGAIRNIADVEKETEVGLLKRFSEALGFKSILFVPLMREGRGIGVFSLARKRTGLFTQREVDLVQTFADQAVIAVENARLFDEVQQRTRELAASLDELRTAQDLLVQTEKLASLGQLTAGIAHEIKNPLNFVNNFSARPHLFRLP